MLHACRKLKRVVKLVDIIENSDSFAIIFEYFEEQSLKEMLDRGSSIDFDNAIKIVKEIANTLKAIHKQGIVHRNLTLNSVRLKLAGNAIKLVVTDFEEAVISEQNSKLKQQYNLDLVTVIESNELVD